MCKCRSAIVCVCEFVDHSEHGESSAKSVKISKRTMSVV